MIASLITLVVAFTLSGLVLSHPRLAALWGQVKQRVSPGACVKVGVLFYCIVLGGMAILRHWSLNSNALDMGLMDQMVWNSAHGRWFEESFISGRPASFLGHHFSPALALLVPFYWLLPRPETLSLVQIGCITGSALLLHRVAFKLTRHAWASAALALMVLLHPLVQDAALFDFHQDAIGMFFLALGLLAIAHQRWGVAALGWLLSIVAKEEVAIYWMAVGLFWLVVERRWWLHKTLFVLLNALWLYLVIVWFIPAFQNPGDVGFFFFARYAFWGNNIAEVFGTIASKPLESLQFLLLPNRVGGLGMMLLPVLLFLLRGRWSLVLLLLPLGINSLADNVGQHNYRFHYSLLPIVMIVYACSWAIVFHQRRGASGSARFMDRVMDRGVLFMLIASAMLFVGVSQMGLRLPTVMQNYLPTRHDRLAAGAFELIPPDAAVIAQNKLAAHLSQRQKITLLSRELVEPADYYLLDLQSPTAPQSSGEYVANVTALLANSAYGVIYAEDGYILLERGASHEQAAVDAAMKRVEQYFSTVISQQ